MKKQLKIAVTIVMTLFMLISTVGFSINKMICLTSGKVKIAVFEDVKCNPDEEQPQNGISTRCCDLSSQYIQVDFISVENPVKTPKISFAPIAILVFSPVFSCLPSFSNYSGTKAPPLPYGTNLLKFISVFRI